MSAQESAELLEFVRQLVRKRSSQTVTPSTMLFEERILTSMNILDLIGFIENRLQRKLGEQELLMINFRSVDDMQRAFFDD
jgi:acyl carrier protein